MDPNSNFSLPPDAQQFSTHSAKPAFSTQLSPQQNRLQETDFDRKYGQYSTQASPAFTQQVMPTQQQQQPNAAQPNMDQLKILQQLLSQQQSQQQYLNMSGSQGTQQNQNLGPTQIFYQQPQQQQQPTQAAQNTQQTQMMLLQLLQQQQQQIQQAQNPSNSSMFGSAFMGATQLLAQSQDNRSMASSMPQTSEVRPQERTFTVDQSFEQEMTRTQSNTTPKIADNYAMKAEQSFHSHSSDHFQPMKAEKAPPTMHAYERSPAKNNWLKEPEPRNDDSSSDVLWPSSKPVDPPKFEAPSAAHHQFMADKRYVEKSTTETPVEKPWHVKKPSFEMPQNQEILRTDTFQSFTESQGKSFSQKSDTKPWQRSQQNVREDERPLTGKVQVLEPAQPAKAALNIDDQVIPALGVQASNFEELLEQKLNSGEVPVSGEARSSSQQPKREFLKRKLKSVTPNQVPPSKKYSYYADAVSRKTGAAPLSRAAPDKPTEVQEPEPKFYERNKSAPSMRPPAKKETPFSSSPFPSRTIEEHPVEEQEKKPKKPFLKAGSGRNAMNSRMRQERPTSTRPEERVASPSNQNRQPARLSSMDEFEKLEQACNQAQSNAYRPQTAAPKQGNTNNNRKLFDSDSEGEQQYEPEPVQKDERSDIVRKMFYNDESSKIPRPSQEPREPALNDQMQALMDQKLQQLDKAIANYHNEHEKLARQKHEYESLQRRLKLDQRDFENQKKRLLEDVDKAKADEHKKLQAERKQLELRQKNLQMVSQGTRREREEIEALKKEVTRLTQEHEQKATRQKKELDRVKKVNSELENKNRDLQDEVRHLTQLLQQQQTQPQKKAEPKAEPSQDSRYSFSQKQQQAKHKRQAAEVEVEYEDSKTLPEPSEDEEPMVAQEDQEPEEDYSLRLPDKYHAKTAANSRVADQVVGHDGKIQRVYQSGKKEVVFTNGVKRETFPDGYTIVYFANEDVKQTFPDQKVVYYFAEAKTTQTTFPDGLQVFKFANQQIEKHFPDGTKEIIFPDGTIKCIFEDGEEESIFPDGTIQRIEKSGIKAIEFANGQKDILFPDGTRVREFPDGRVRKTYPDGRTETKAAR